MPFSDNRFNGQGFIRNRKNFKKIIADKKYFKILMINFITPIH